MRITGKRTSDNYWRIFFVTSPIISLDGQVILHVTIADDVEGFVVVEEYDDNGKLKVGNGRVLTRRINGKVEITGERRTRGKTLAELEAIDFMRDVMEEEGVE